MLLSIDIEVPINIESLDLLMSYRFEYGGIEYKYNKMIVVNNVYRVIYKPFKNKYGSFYINGFVPQIELIVNNELEIVKVACKQNVYMKFFSCFTYAFCILMQSVVFFKCRGIPSIADSDNLSLYLPLLFLFLIVILNIIICMINIFCIRKRIKKLTDDQGTVL